VGIQNGEATLEEFGRFFPYHSVATLFGICPNELKPYVQKKICMQIFIAVLFTIARTKK
jgi:hypothetical protein